MMNQLELADSIEWHDGILHEVKISHEDEISVKIIAEIYKDQINDKERIPIVMDFFRVNMINFCIDGDEMKDNRGAGNISHGYIKKSIPRSKKYKFFLYLCDGLISFTFYEVKLTGLPI